MLRRFKITRNKDCKSNYCYPSILSVTRSMYRGMISGKFREANIHARGRGFPPMSKIPFYNQSRSILRLKSMEKGISLPSAANVTRERREVRLRYL